MTDYDSFFQAKLDHLKQQGNYRYFLSVNKSAQHFPQFYFEHEGIRRSAINFCSNDYLGMSTEEEVIIKFSFILHKSGAGSGGTRNLSGNTDHHQTLEQTLSRWHHKPAALIFGGAYLANLTALQTLGRHLPELVFISDERNHASIIEGMRSAGNVKYIFRHNDMSHLREILSALPIEQPKMIVFESVYSMNGSVAPLKCIVKLANEFKALTYVDEVHAVGLYGATGAGMCEQENISNEVDVINGTLAKAVGVVGGYIASSERLIDFVRSFGSGFIFTSALPPAVCAAATKSIQHIQRNRFVRQTVHSLVHYLRQELTEAQILYVENDSHITPIKIAGAAKCKAIADELLHTHGMYVQPVNYPTVPLGEECLRIIVTARHNRKQVNQLVKSLSIVLTKASIVKRDFLYIKGSKRNHLSVSQQ